MQRIDVVAAVVIQADNLDGVTVFRLSGSDSSQELLSARGNSGQHNTPKLCRRTHNLIHDAKSEAAFDVKSESN